MKKLLAVACALLFLGATAALAADAPAGPIKVTNFGKKDVVTFDHAKHASADCATCHHKSDEGYKCSGCHKDSDAMKDAAHAKETGKCWVCHNKSSAKVVKELKCADCHKG